MLANFVDRADVGVIECGRSLRFAEQPPPFVLGAGRIGRQDLDGDEPLQAAVFSEIDLAHAPAPESSADLVLPKARVRRE